MALIWDDHPTEPRPYRPPIRRLLGPVDWLVLALSFALLLVVAVLR